MTDRLCVVLGALSNPPPLRSISHGNFCLHSESGPSNANQSPPLAEVLRGCETYSQTARAGPSGTRSRVQILVPGSAHFSPPPPPGSLPPSSFSPGVLAPHLLFWSLVSGVLVPVCVSYLISSPCLTSNPYKGGSGSGRSGVEICDVETSLCFLGTGEDRTCHVKVSFFFCFVVVFS